MMVRFLHTHKSVDDMVKIEIEIQDAGFKSTQFGFDEKFSKIIIYDIDLLKNRKFLAILREHDILLI